MKKRENWIDIVRAIAMLFVVIGHSYGKSGTVYYVLTGPIKMPLFYIVSGYFLNVN